MDLCSAASPLVLFDCNPSVRQAERFRCDSQAFLLTSVLLLQPCGDAAPWAFPVSFLCIWACLFFFSERYLKLFQVSLLSSFLRSPYFPPLGLFSSLFLQFLFFASDHGNCFEGLSRTGTVHHYLFFLRLFILE